MCSCTSHWRGYMVTFPVNYEERDLVCQSRNRAEPRPRLLKRLTNILGILARKGRRASSLKKKRAGRADFYAKVQRNGKRLDVTLAGCIFRNRGAGSRGEINAAREILRETKEICYRVSTLGSFSLLLAKYPIICTAIDHYCTQRVCC